MYNELGAQTLNWQLQVWNSSNDRVVPGSGDWVAAVITQQTTLGGATLVAGPLVYVFKPP